MKEKFDAYVQWPLAKRIQYWIVARSTARDFTVSMKTISGWQWNILPRLFEESISWNFKITTINWPNDLIFSSSTYLLCLKLHNCTFIDTHYMHRCIDLTELMTCYIFFLCLTINSNQESKWLLNVNCKLLDGLIFSKLFY